MSTRKKRLTAAERRAQLMQVGRTVFAETGFESASLEVIAQRAGVTKPIIYEHFGSKEGLHAAIVEREMDALVTRVSEAMSEGSARARFEGAVVEFMTYASEQPAGFAVLTRETPTPARPGMTRVIDQLTERVGAVFSRELARAGYDRKLAPIYATALLGMVTQVGRWWAVEGRRVSRDQVVRHVAALGWMGLRHLPKTPAKVLERKQRS
ncbi:MAG TPA: TetR/AcrR family transcriptional regulator [Thermoanaerobaculia bacterium]|jgi:AcrR family transcriptional regulator|nr:TetR/AcrR family transcriptional regulator [Thermoanaerobaculia bacterium]